ncbi:helix-turn-helix transcriptional regulator [Mesorhizobium sp. ORM8.1]
MNVLSPVSADPRDRVWSGSAFEMSGVGASSEIWDAIVAAGASIGDEVFYDRLLDVLGALVEGDLLSLVRYSSFGAPDLIIPREISAEVAAPYNSGLYAFDPFHHYWQAVGRPAVKSLRGLAPADLWTCGYALEFLRAACISDEIAVFLPPIGGASPTLILDRASGRFTAAELARVERVLPLLTGLHNAHLKSIVSRGLIAHAAEKPLRLIDRSGKELAANIAWKKLVAEAGSGLSEALAAFGSTGVTQTSLPDGRLLIRSPLAADFGAAPGGLCDQVEVPALSGPVAPPDSWLEPLTHRERQIVLLTLEGHPIAGIAKRLGVRPGTIKNHRLRLYQKLDITTERELFLTHMRYLRGAGT